MKEAEKLNVDTKKVNKMLASWIVMNQLPFTIVESSEFHQFVNYINPAATVYRGNAIKREISLIYKKMIKKMKAVIAECKKSRRFSMTTDAWTSPNNKVFFSVKLSNCLGVFGRDY